jgi:hypothetical protein
MVTTSIYPASRVLDGVPCIGFHRHLSPFPGSLFACQEYLGEEPDYDFLMGASGAAFRRLWNRDDGGNIDLSHLGDTPFKLVFDALGYEWRAVPIEKSAMIAAIQESLERGVPVISFGILGPPEAGIVTGYREDGAVLLGWSYFQTDNQAYYEKSDWFETLQSNTLRGLIVIGEKRASHPSDRQVLISTLEFALDLARQPVRPNLPDHASGLAAYQAWADELEVDADYAAEDAETMNWRAMIYGDQCIMLEERKHAAGFLHKMAQRVPEAALDLEAAAIRYTEVGNLITEIWSWGETYDGFVQTMGGFGIRRGMSALIRKAGSLEADALVYLEEALEQIPAKE